MYDDFELTITYPPNEAGDWINSDLDEQIIDAVGTQCSGSGAGPLTGGRDLYFNFKTRLNAEHAVHRVKDILSDVDYKWEIVLWDGGSHRTLAMGVNGSVLGTSERIGR